MSISSDWANRIRRSRLATVLGAYAAASFGVLQMVDVFTNRLGLPDWVFPFSIVLLAVGLPIVIATALVQATGPSYGAAGAAGPETAPGSTSPDAAPLSPADAATSQPASTAGGSPAPRRHWLTWRRSLLGGLAAFALLALGVAGYMGMRALGIGPVGSLIAKGALSDRGRILVADFDAPRGDTLLATTVTDAFRIDLAQSDALTVAEPDFVSAALRRMERPETSHLDAALAREIAQREGIKAIIKGELNTIGGRYVLAAQIVTADSGRVLGTFRETAADSSALLPALDRLSSALRERVGESLRSIRASEPLEQVTTASLPALRAYSTAVRLAESEGNQAAAIPLLEGAVARDTGFAMAYRKLGIILANMGAARERQIDALQRAYAHRDRLTERERGMVEASYYLIRHDWRKAAESYEALLAEYPDYPGALTNLSVTYSNMRRLQDAERVGRRALALDPSNSLMIGNLIEFVVADGRLAEADSLWAAMHKRWGDTRTSFYYAMRLAEVRGQIDTARAMVVRALARDGANPGPAAGDHFALARYAALEGRLSEARAQAATAAGEARRAGAPDWALAIAATPALLDAAVLGDTARAARDLEAVATEAQLDRIAPLERPYLEVAYAWGRAGRAAPARAALAAYDRVTPPELREEAHRHGDLGVVALAEGHPVEAVRELTLADQGPCRYCALPDLARAWDAAGRPDSARATYERYLSTQDISRSSDTDWIELPLVHERLAQLYAAAGDRDRAAAHAVAFLQLWAHADPELQPRVEAMRRLLARLAPDATPR